ncbi:MAG: aspartate aminotransferase family protein [Deltaproteobacteria bacterium]|nr:MAG: aspartate aminotransferase family protein [Deltaproteobacteria bacterium]
MNRKKSLEYIERDKKVVSRVSRLSYFPLVIESGQGAKIIDVDGNEYIDFLSSASSLNLGSSHPAVTRAIEEQLKKISQYTAAYTYNTPLIEYAERLCSIYPGGEEARVVFGNCGSDANDAAIKFSRAYTGRNRIITFINSYHGSTYGSLSLTAVTTRMRKKLGALLPGVEHFKFYGSDLDDDLVSREAVRDLEEAFHTYLPADEVAAVIIEPVQGDAGNIPAHPIFMKKLYELCRQHGILFISEEVQMGFFRTGKWFSIEHYEGIIPDGIIMGKSFGAGLTAGCFMAKKDIAQCLESPAHLFTLGANHLVCAAGAAAFDVYKSQEFQDELKIKNALLKELAEDLMKKHEDMVMFVRGLGLSYGIGLGSKVDGVLAGDDTATFKILYRCFEKGLIVISLAGNILRIQPPLVITEEELKKGFEIIGQAITEYKEGKIPDSVLEHQKGW